MEDFKDGRSPYEVLELPKGPDSTPDEIKKVRNIIQDAFNHAAAAQLFPQMQ